MELSPQGIPILDLSPAIHGHSSPQLTNLVNYIASASESLGCFYIKNHGVDQSVIDNLFHDLRDFFTRPTDYKIKYKSKSNKWYSVSAHVNIGYHPLLSLNTNAFMGEKDHPNDPLESLAFNSPVPIPKYLLPPNIYPDHPGTLKENVEIYYESLKNLGTIMMRVLSMAANAPDEEYFVRNSFNAPHPLVSIFYPIHNNPGLGWMPAHTDVGSVAIIASDATPNSLQVKNIHNEWVYADPIPGTFIILIGRTLQRWTNDKWKAVEHCVVLPDKDALADRLSVVFFASMHLDTVIECLPSCMVNGKAKHKPIMYKDFVEEEVHE